MAPAVAVSDELVLERYRPIRPLGSGGSGSVWLARDEREDRDVALKIVARDGKAGSRAEREAAAAARLAHERCQRAYALASDEEHVYIAYEYVAGRTFRDVLRAGELSDADAIEAAAQVLDGLAHAHARGIVHRDVKPANVLLADGPDVSVRLLDFGLAQFAEAETLTAAGDVPGTLAYIAPERLRGEPGGPAGDVWSAGVLLWEALAGRHPFWAPSLLDTAKRIQAGPQALGAVRPDLPKAVAAAVDGALAANPARRPSAAAFASALRRAWRRSRIAVPRPPVSADPGPARTPPPALVRRGLAAALAGLFAGWTAFALPFYPAGWPAALALLCGGLALFRPRASLALALAVPVLPLGNIALGLAIAYAVLAAGWFALFAKDPPAGLVFALGPLLAPLAAVALVPLALIWVRHPLRRALAACGAVLAAALVSGVRGVPVPLTGEEPPGSLALAATEDPLEAATTVARALFEHPAIALQAGVFALAAAALPLARRYGPWALAALGAAFLTAALVPASDVAAAPVVAAVWITCAALSVTPAAARDLVDRLDLARRRATIGPGKCAGIFQGK